MARRVPDVDEPLDTRGVCSLLVETSITMMIAEMTYRFVVAGYNRPPDHLGQPYDLFTQMNTLSW